MSGYPGVPEFMSNPTEWLRLSKTVFAGIMQGKTNNYGTVTLSAGTTSTVVTEAPNRISNTVVILFMPTTANAAVEAQTMYVSATNPLANTFTITHANNAQVDRTLRYALIG